MGRPAAESLPVGWSEARSHLETSAVQHIQNRIRLQFRDSQTNARGGPARKDGSMKTDRQRWDAAIVWGAAIVVLRWSARILGLMIAGVILLMFIGYSLQGSSPLPDDPVGFSLIVIYAVAMFLALKWEREGSLLGVAALGGYFVWLFLGLHPGIPGGFSSIGIVNPTFLTLWLPILFYLLCWGLEGLGLGANEGGSLKR